jgi:hypothetical protein
MLDKYIDNLYNFFMNIKMITMKDNMKSGMCIQSIEIIFKKLQQSSKNEK